MDSQCPVQALTTGEVEANQGDRCTIGELGEHTVGSDRTLAHGDLVRFLP